MTMPLKCCSFAAGYESDGHLPVDFVNAAWLAANPNSKPLPLMSSAVLAILQCCSRCASGPCHSQRMLHLCQAVWYALVHFSLDVARAVFHVELRYRGGVYVTLTPQNQHVEFIYMSTVASQNYQGFCGAAFDVPARTSLDEDIVAYKGNCTAGPSTSLHLSLRLLLCTSPYHRPAAVHEYFVGCRPPPLAY